MLTCVACLTDGMQFILVGGYSPIHRRENCMKVFARSLRLTPLVFVLLVCQVLHAAPADSLAAGMAEIDITPPVGYRMAGYFDERLSTGIHDPLKAKALVLQQGTQRFALVFCDLVGPSLHVTTNARTRAS